MNLESLKKHYDDDMRSIQLEYVHWYNFNQRYKNALFLFAVIAGAGTLVTATTLDGTALKFAAASFGAISTITAALQRFMKAGAKAEFYGRYVKELHVLRLKIPFVIVENDLREIVSSYATILLMEAKLSRDEDNNRTVDSELEELRKKLEDN